MTTDTSTPSERDLALLDMLSLVYEEMDVDAIEERFVDLTARIFDFDRVALFFVKHRRGVLQGKLCKGFQAGTISALEIPLSGHHPFTLPLITGFPVRAAELGDDPLLARLGLQSPHCAIVPVVSKRRLGCWQIKRCNQRDCPAYGKRWLRCWMVAGRKCSAVDGRPASDEYCRQCEVYARQDVNAVEGILLVDNTPSGRPITSETVTILSIIAHAVGAAINNTKTYTRTLQAAIRDDLTGLPNRRYCNERLLEEIDRARRYGSGFCLAICDLDHFKAINDTFGHPVGDEVLRAVATTLRQHLRASDLVARYGGEEFAILLLNTGPEKAGQLADHLRCTLAETRIPAIGDRQITASFGLAFFGAGGATSFDGLVARADRALYQAKAQGRNRVCTA